MAVQTKPRTRFTFDRYLNARSAQSPDFSPDGRNVCFVSDITGVPQLWQVPAEGGWPDQLTFTNDRVMAGIYAHHAPEILFAMDSGGNELAQFYLLRDDEVKDVVVEPRVFHAFGAISWDDRRIAFSDNRRDPRFFDVYVCDIDGSNERLVYQHDGTNYVTDWSRDGRYLLIQRQEGSMNNDLFLLDLETEELTHLTPHQPPVNYLSARFTPDGKAIYLISDQGSEFLRAARMDLGTRQLELLTPDDVDIDALLLSPDGRSLALIRNDKGYGKLSVWSVETGEERVAALPDGVPQQPTWSEDSNTIAFAFTGPADNLNIWIWDLDANACRQITHVTLGGVPRQSFVAPELIHFHSFDGLKVPAFLYMPPGADKPPVVVHVHGGPEGQARPIFMPIIQYFVNRGYAVLAPNVRGSTGYGRTYTHLDDVERRMDSVADLKAAAEWLRGSGRVDGEKIAVMGGSYGGFMVLAALTTYPDIWAVGVDIVGVANFETFFKNTSAYRRKHRAAEYGDPEKDVELFRRISPIHYVDRIEAPLILIHGDNDPRVPLNEAEQIAAAMERRGRPVQLLRFPDEGHGIVKLKNKLVAYPAIGEFLDTYLG